jgi:hypothetical protein
VFGKRLRRLLLTAGTAAVVAVPMTFGTAGTASADQGSGMAPGWAELCNSASNYGSFVEFPYRGYWASTMVRPGNCWSHYMGGIGWEPTYVMGVNNGVAFWINTVGYDGYQAGVGITTGGSTGAPWSYTW